jgi:hypothetical protein
MKRQVAKGLAMLMVTLALAAASAVVANGQTPQGLAAQVPFDFMVGDKTLHAGQYTVRALNDSGNPIAIKNNDGDRVIQLSYTAERSDKQLRAKLVFHRYGSNYFLSQIWMAGESNGRELPKTRQERAIERELKVIASNGRTYDVVEVVALAR